MRARLAHKLEETWYGKSKPGKLLGVLERVYYLGFRAHQRYQRMRRADDLHHAPIIVVGNLTAGGSGKTPFVIALVELAKQAGFRPGVISRGYGRKSNEPVSVKADHHPDICGDEPLLIARHTQSPVQVDSDREQAARDLMKSGVNLVISDDGLQRARMPRRLEVCIMDRRRGAGNGRLLPAGPLREPLSRLENVEIVVEHIAPGVNPQASEGFTMQLQPGLFRRLHVEESRTVSELRTVGKKIHAVAGIAEPQRFWSTLRHLGLQFEEHPFPDHHRFHKGDFSSFGADDIVLMTEKDAVKCSNLALFNAWYLPVTAQFSEGLEQRLLNALEQFSHQAGASSS